MSVSYFIHTNRMIDMVTSCVTLVKMLKSYASAYIKLQDGEETLILASKQMSQLCAENILSWHRFLDSVVGKEEVRRKLANEHHLERVRRWTEGNG